MQDWNEHSGQIIVGCSGVCAGIGGIYLLENGGESKSTSPEIILKSRHRCDIIFCYGDQPDLSILHKTISDS